MPKPEALMDRVALQLHTCLTPLQSIRDQGRTAARPHIPPGTDRDGRTAVGLKDLADILVPDCLSMSSTLKEDAWCQIQHKK